MKKSFLKGSSVIILTTLMLSGCSKFPQAEIDQTKLAIQAADSAGASIYADSNFVALQDSFNAVLVNIEAKNSGFLKNFSAQKEKLAGITRLAEDVKQQAENRKAEVKNEIMKTITEVKALIDSTNALILQAPKG